MWVEQMEPGTMILVVNYLVTKIHWRSKFFLCGDLFAELVTLTKNKDPTFP
jgi:hypothetical protein